MPTVTWARLSRRNSSASLLVRMMATTTANPSSSSSSGDSSKPPLKKRSVVSSFLYKFVDENGERKPKVALFKRSGQVRTYP